MEDLKVYQASGYLTKLVTYASDVRKEYEEISGSLVQFVTPISAPLASLIVDINPVQSGSGEPSPTNILPITGWTGASVTRTGKNVFQSPYDVQKPSGYNGSWEGVSVVDGWVVQTGNPIGAGGHGGAVAHNIKAGVYTLSFKCDYSELVGTTSMAYNVWAEYADGTKATIVSPQYSITATVVKKTITLEKDVKDLALRATSGGSNTSSVFKYTDIQLELGSTATDYEAYQGTTLSVTFPDTVYGGKYDFVSGGLTNKKVSFNAKDVSWNDAGSGRVYTSLSLSPTELTTPLCSHCEYHRRPESGAYDNWIDWGGYPNSNKNLIVTLKGITDTLSQWNTYIQNNDVQFVYELETPVEYQLTPEEINTLIGVNNIWADTGDVSVKYRTH